MCCSLRINRKSFVLLGSAVLIGMVSGCTYSKGREQKPAPADSAALRDALHRLNLKYAPDKHMGIFSVGCDWRGGQLVLTGEVDRAEAKLQALAAATREGIKATDRISVLPAATLGENTWGIACLSVASGREQPDHKAEMVTQILMGHSVRIWKSSSFWSLVQSSDGYLSWVENGALVRCTQETVDAWKKSKLLIVTSFEEC